MSIQGRNQGGGASCPPSPTHKNGKEVNKWEGKKGRKKIKRRKGKGEEKKRREKERKRKKEKGNKKKKGKERRWEGLYEKEN